MKDLLEKVEEILLWEEKASSGNWFFDSYSRIHSEELVKQYIDIEEKLTDDSPDEEYAKLPNTEIATVPIISGDTGTPQGRIDGRFIELARNNIKDLAENYKEAFELLKSIRKAMMLADDAQSKDMLSSMYSRVNEVQGMLDSIFEYKSDKLKTDWSALKKIDK